MVCIKDLFFFQDFNYTFKFKHGKKLYESVATTSCYESGLIIIIINIILTYTGKPIDRNWTVLLWFSLFAFLMYVNVNYYFTRRKIATIQRQHIAYNNKIILRIFLTLVKIVIICFFCFFCV